MDNSTPATARRRYRQHRARARAFVPVTRALDLATLLHHHGHADVVYLVGPRPGRDVSGFSAWLAGPLPEGWASDGHYLARLHRPVLRFAHRDGRRVEVHRASAWFGEGDYAPSQAGDALALLDDALRASFDEHARALNTPATTGRDLWLRSIPHGAEYPCLSDEHQQLIRSTSGQGRWELHHHGAETLPGLVGYDMRYGYAAMLWGLGVGPAVHDTVPEYAGQQRGRYRVRVTVPAGWRHVGLLPFAEDDGETWSYPSEPGRTFVTWADGAELHVAYAYGWDVAILERLLLVNGKPLDAWQTRMIDVRDRLLAQVRAGEADVATATLAADAARMCLLAAVGAFHGAPREVTRSSADVSMIPAGASGVDYSDAAWTWTETVAAAWPETVHPEWSAAVWARCRARLLTSRQSTGALHVARENVIAMRQDGLYLTADPGWSDTGRVGAMRRTTVIDRPVLAPRTVADLLELVR